MTRFQKILNIKLGGLPSADLIHWGFQRGTTRKTLPSPHRAVAMAAQGDKVLACLFYEVEPDTPFVQFAESVKLYHPALSLATVLRDDMGTRSDLRRCGIAATVQRAPMSVGTELLVPEDATVAKLAHWDILMAATATTCLSQDADVVWV